MILNWVLVCTMGYFLTCEVLVKHRQKRGSILP